MPFCSLHLQLHKNDMDGSWRQVPIKSHHEFEAPNKDENKKIAKNDGEASKNMFEAFSDDDATSKLGARGYCTMSSRDVNQPDVKNMNDQSEPNEIIRFSSIIN